MRAVVFVAILGLVAGNLCRSGDEPILDEYKQMGQTVGNMIIGSSCKYLSKNFEKVFLGKQCKALTQQGLCYLIRSAERYGDSPTVTYDQLAGDLPNISHLGELSCKHAVKCYKQIAKAVKKCMRSNDNFIEELFGNAQILYRVKAQDIVNEFIANHQNTLFGELANLAVANFRSINDVKAFFAEYVDRDLEAQVSSDAQVAAREVQKLAHQWCKSGCSQDSTDFLQELFGNMHGGQCVDAAQFCGACQENANRHFKSGGQQIPCCLDDILQKGIAAYDYVSAAYGARIDEWVGLVSQELSDEANAKAAEFAAEVNRQSACIADAYDEHNPDCSSR